MTNNRQRRGGGIGGTILGFIIIAALAMVVWFFLKSIFAVLSFVAPVLLISTLFLNFDVVKDYGKFLVNTMKTNPGMGILYGVGTFLAFPLVVAYLFSKALITRQIGKKFGKKKEKFDGYEDITDKKKEEDEDFLELPELEKPQVTVRQNTNSGAKSRGGNEYEDLF